MLSGAFQWEVSLEKLYKTDDGKSLEHNIISEEDRREIIIPKWETLFRSLLQEQRAGVGLSSVDLSPSLQLLGNLL